MKKIIILLSYILIVVVIVLLYLDIIPLTTYFIIALSISIAIFIIGYQERIKRQTKTQEELDKKLKEIEQKSEASPDKTKYSWDIARIKLEAYFDRNLSQVNSIFWISILVMIAGFCFIIWSILISINKQEILPITYIASISGILTEFIGATFMLIYKSTIKQATSNMNVLERMNSVGMAMQILDSIPESDEKLKSQTKSEITKLLLNHKQKENYS